MMMKLLGAAAARTARRRLGRRKPPTISSPRRRPLSSASPPPPSDDEDPLAAVRLTVNGRAVSVPRGLSVLEAARSCGVLIPTLCAHPRLDFIPSPSSRNDHQGFISNAGVSEGGLCRVCLVDVGGGRLAPACATPASAGMEVKTDTKEVKRTVRGVLALLRASGSHADCATCEASGECELQDLLARYHIVEGSPRRRAAGHHEWDEEGSRSDEGEEEIFPFSSSSSPLPRKHDQDSWRLSAVDSSTGAVAVDLSKCVECGRCVSACGLLQGIGAIGFAGRGAARHVATFGGDEGSPLLSASPCIGCGQCSLACPTGAIEAVPHWRRVLGELEARRRPLAVQVAPAVRVAVGEEAGLEPGRVATGQLVAALRLLGFDFVFDTNFAADVTVVEESAELLRRLRGGGGSEGGGGGGGGGGSGEVSPSSSSSSSPCPRPAPPPPPPPPPPPMPLFTSCCPAWITMAEKSFPELVRNGHLSTAKSPHIILGTLAKKFWAPSVGLDGARLHVTSVMPCTAKKAEAARGDLLVEVPTGGGGGGGERAGAESTPTALVPAVDAVITTRELGRMLRARGIPLASLESSEFDSPLGDSSGAAALFGATGGVAEAAMRSAYKALVGSEAPTGADGANPLRPLRGLAGVKELVLPLPATGRARELAGGREELRVAVASGAGAARALVGGIARGDPSLPRFDFVEVMACPGGCVGGGGQPRVADQAAALAARAAAIYELDERSATRRAHENEGVRDLYARFLGGEAGSEVAERELHREYGGEGGRGEGGGKGREKR